MHSRPQQPAPATWGHRSPAGSARLTGRRDMSIGGRRASARSDGCMNARLPATSTHPPWTQLLTCCLHTAGGGHVHACRPQAASSRRRPSCAARSRLRPARPCWRTGLGPCRAQFEALGCQERVGDGAGAAGGLDERGWAAPSSSGKQALQQRNPKSRGLPPAHLRPPRPHLSRLPLVRRLGAPPADPARDSHARCRPG